MPVSSKPPRRSRRWPTARLLTSVSLFLPGYALLAYLVVPAAWARYERHLAPRDTLRITHTAERIPGDPLNVALVGTREDVVAAMRAAGWTEADRITLRSGLRDAGSVLFDRPYASAPVSTHLLWNRPQDLAFERVVGRSPRRRHHVRLWQSEAVDATGAFLWVGAATYDRGVGLSRYTGEVIHHIDPKVDAEREELFRDLSHTERLDRIERIGRFRPAGRGVNGGGDAYETDGTLLLGRLRAGI
jgi:LssY C-terminus